MTRNILLKILLVPVRLVVASPLSLLSFVNESSLVFPRSVRAEHVSVLSLFPSFLFSTSRLFPICTVNGAGVGGGPELALSLDEIPAALPRPASRRWDSVPLSRGEQGGGRAGAPDALLLPRPGRYCE